MPLLAFLGESPTFFTFRNTTGTDILIAATLIALVPPLVLWGIEMLVGVLDERVAAATHLVLCGILTALAVAPFLAAAIPAAAALAVGCVAGAGLVWLYANQGWAASFLRYLAILPFMAVGMFVFDSATGELALANRAGASTPADGTDRASVVFIVLDEFPTKSLIDTTGVIDPVRFPNIASFAETSTWYPNYTALTTHTTYSVPAILTGTWPEEVEPIWTNYPDSLFTMLAPTHDLVVSESFTEMCGLEACAGSVASTSENNAGGGVLTGVVDAWMDRLTGRSDLESRDDFEEELVGPIPLSEDIGLDNAIRTLRSQPQRHADFLAALEPGSGPGLYFEHLVLPHSPFRLYPDGSQYDEEGFPLPRLHPDEPWPAALHEQRHLLQAQHTDALVGQVIDRLHEVDLFESSLVVVTADHGVSHELGTPLRDYVEGTIDSHAYSPLLIKAPGQSEGTIDGSNLSSLDVIPTVADMLSISVPWPTDGEPAGSAQVANRSDTKEFLEVAPLWLGAVIGDRFSFDGADEAPRAEDRWIGDIADGLDPVAGLLETLQASDLVDVPVADIPLDPHVTGTHSTAEALADPASPPTAQIAGTLDAMPDGGEVLAAVDGVIVTGSRLYLNVDGETAFAALLPLHLLGQPIEPELYWWSGGESLAPIRVNG